MTIRSLAVVVLVAATAISPLSRRASARPALSPADPETVVITLRAKPGADAALAGVIARHWETARQLNLVQPTPHLTVRGTDRQGRIYFVDIFTWRDGAIPDAAPAPILRIWDEMSQLVESRDGKPGIDIAPVAMVTDTTPQSQ